MSPDLTPDGLDAFARDYYLASDIADIDIEDLQQELSMDLIAETVAGAERVLELGYGVGITTRALRERGVPIEVIEGSPLLAARARERHEGLVVHEGLFEDWTPEQPYDAVLALHVVEHVDDPLRLLGHVRDWIVPGGTIVVVVPNAESLHRRIGVRMGLQPELDTLSERDVLVGHQRVYTLDALAGDLEAAGFSARRRFGWFLKTLPNSMMLGFPPEMLTALFTISGELDPSLLANIGIAATKPA